MKEPNQQPRPMTPREWIDFFKERYRIKVLPFGFTCTLEEYQRWRYEATLQHFYTHYDAVNAEMVYQAVWELLEEVKRQIQAKNETLWVME